MICRLLLIFALLVVQLPLESAVYAQEDDVIEVDLGDESNDTKEAEDEIEIPADKEEEKEEKKDRLDLTKFHFDFYGNLFYSFMMNQVKQSNSKEYNNFHINNIYTDTVIGLRFLNKSDI
ncbi:MAG: hypothetical protein KKH98_15415, partial [Spirochaetes bacterium]|nr:hypothetical protein [Spirochaetota bacterium]